MSGWFIWDMISTDVKKKAKQNQTISQKPVSLFSSSDRINNAFATLHNSFNTLTDDSEN